MKNSKKIVNVDWNKTCRQFENEMKIKLRKLPQHKDVPESCRELRKIISHELPETSDLIIFITLINSLLNDKSIDLEETKSKYIIPEKVKEHEILTRHQKEYRKLKKSASLWLTNNFSEEELIKKWRSHDTWLPRRYTIYKNQKTPFQKIASDTLARYYLINTLNALEIFLGKEVEVVIDRPKGSKHPKFGFTYETNYGYIPNTKAPDGEEIDAYFLGINKPVKKAKGICVAIIERTNDNDDKLIVIPKGKKISDKEIDKQTEFQEKWFKHIIIRG